MLGVGILGRLLFSPWLWGGIGVLAISGYIFHQGIAYNQRQWADLISGVNSDIHRWQLQLAAGDAKHQQEIDKAVADANARIASSSKGPQCSIDDGIARQITTIAGVK